MFAAYNAHASYYSYMVICGLSGSTVKFPQYLKTERFSEKGYWTQHVPRVLIFSTTYGRNISLSKKDWARYHNYVYRPLCYPLVIHYSKTNDTQFSLNFLKIKELNVSSITCSSSGVAQQAAQGYYKKNKHFHNLRSSVEERWKFVSRHSFVTSAPRQRPWHHWSKIFPLRYYVNCVSTTLTVLILQ
jgi:hypothetical protein